MKRILILPVRSFFIIFFVYPAVLSIFFTSLAAGVIGGFWLGWGEVILIFLGGTLVATVYLRGIIRRESKRIGSSPDEVALNVRAPFLPTGRSTKMQNCDELDLGDRPLSLPFRIEIYVHNCSEQTYQISTELDWDRSVLALKDLDTSKISGVFSSKEVKKLEVQVLPTALTGKTTEIVIECRYDNGTSRKALRIRSIFEVSEKSIKDARINRWKYGCLAAVCWRGDIDGLDNLTNEATLEPAFRLSAGFKVPISLFISGRLSFNFKEWLAWIRHFPEKFDDPDKSKDRFDRFASYLRERVCENGLEYPIRDERCLAEAGSHMYLHYKSPYGYDAKEAGGWRTNTDPGGPSAKDDGDISERLRLDLIKNQEVLQESLGIVPKTWAAPGDVGHVLMPKALESAGLVGASEACPRISSRIFSRIAPYRPDLGAVRPYHPQGTRIVETQAHIKRFDPFTPTHLICLKRAILKALGDGTQVTFLVHPHLRLYSPFFGPRSSEGCLREFLRFLVVEKGSVCWITTHSSIVGYWERVLCPEHRVLSIEHSGNQLRVLNNSEDPLEEIPLEVEFEGGKRSVFKVDIPAKTSLQVLPSPRTLPESRATNHKG